MSAQFSDIRVGELASEASVAFGTSGVRGKVDSLSDQVCYAYTKAFLQHLGASRARGGRVAVAGDLRPSTPRIMGAVSAAVCDAGLDPINCGNIPTPALALFGISEGIPSVMVTGSHIPADRNGIKFYRPDGEILKNDEAAILEQRVTVPNPLPNAVAGWFSKVNGAARDRYIGRYAGFFGPNALRGIRIGLYEHSSVARELVGEILERLGGQVERLGRSDVFVPVDTEAIRREDVVRGMHWANGGRFDALVSTDGDGDRPLISDERGVWLRGDAVGVLCAKHLGVQRLVTPVSSNTVAEVSGWFGDVVRTRIGSPYVIEAMLEVGRTPVAGYEANGGFLLGSTVRRGETELAPLPTRDAVLPIVSVLELAREAGVSLRGLLETLPKRFTASDRLSDFPTDCSQAILGDLVDRCLGDGSAGQKTPFFSLCGPLAGFDCTDGVRMTFSSGDIIHIRPSGNAPELRCYTEASSQRRADELNHEVLRVLEKRIGE